MYATLALLASYIIAASCQRHSIPQAVVESCWIGRAGGPNAAYCGNWVCDTPTNIQGNAALALTIGVYFGTNLLAGTPLVPGNNVGIQYFGRVLSTKTDSTGLKNHVRNALNNKRIPNNWACYNVIAGPAAAGANIGDERAAVIEAIMLSAFEFSLNDWKHLGGGDNIPAFVNTQTVAAAGDVIVASNNFMGANFNVRMNRIVTGMIA